MCNFVFSFRKQVEPEVFRSEPSFLEYNKEIIVFSPKLSISQVAQVVKNPPASAGDVRDSGFDPWVGKIPLEEDMSSSILAWRIPWTEEPGGLQSIGSQSWI